MPPALWNENDSTRAGVADGSTEEPVLGVASNVAFCVAVSYMPATKSSNPTGSNVHPRYPKTPPPSGFGVLHEAAPRVEQSVSSSVPMPPMPAVPNRPRPP